MSPPHPWGAIHLGVLCPLHAKYLGVFCYFVELLHSYEWVFYVHRLLQFIVGRGITVAF